MAPSARNPRTDPSAAVGVEPAVRALAFVSGLGRIAIGVGLALAPRQALAALGFREQGAATIAVARIAGGRDIALGAATLAALGDRERLRAASIANAAVDAGDALTFGTALAGGDEAVREAGLRGVGAAVPATIAGAWIASRLGRGA